ARVAGMKSLPGRRLADVVDKFTLVKGIKKCGEAAQVESCRAAAKQVVVNAHQFGENRTDVFATWRELDAHKLLDRVVPRNSVGHRGDVVHAVDNGHVLVVIEIFAELFEAAVQVADVGDGLDDGFPIERQE